SPGDVVPNSPSFLSMPTYVNNSCWRIAFPSFMPPNRLPPGEFRNMSDLLGTLDASRNSRSCSPDLSSISPSPNTYHAVTANMGDGGGGLPWNLIALALLMKVVEIAKERESRRSVQRIFCI